MCQYHGRGAPWESLTLSHHDGDQTAGYLAQISPQDYSLQSSDVNGLMFPSDQICMSNGHFQCGCRHGGPASLDLQEETENISSVGCLTDFLKLSAEQKYCQ